MAKPSDLAPILPNHSCKLARFGIIGAYTNHGAQLPARTMNAANDDEAERASLFGVKAVGEQTLQAALRYFAEHGLGAAREARTQAEKAFFLGDRQAYDWWIGITRTLDRRLAAEAVKQMTPQTS